VTHGQCDARPTVTFPVAERHRPLAGTKLYCLVTEAHGCEQLAQSCYSVADRPGVELATFRSRANALPTEPPSHPTAWNSLPDSLRDPLLCSSMILRYINSIFTFTFTFTRTRMGFMFSFRYVISYLANGNHKCSKKESLSVLHPLLEAD